jgi:hypothetical protein
VLLKLREMIASTRPDAPLNAQLYEDVKQALVQFQMDPVLPPPSIIMECVEFLQKRLIAYANASPHFQP